MKRINIGLNRASIQEAIRQIEEYKIGLRKKCDIFVQRLAQEGMDVAKAIVYSGAGDTEDAVSFTIKPIPGVDISGCYLIMSSNGREFEGVIFYPHLAYEFGAGIYYNNGAGNPYASKVGMGPGTFPGQHWAINPGYWWYKKEGEDAATHLSYGTQATMPMYNATLEMKRNMYRIAREVFKYG